MPGKLVVDRAICEKPLPTDRDQYLAHDGRIMCRECCYEVDRDLKEAGLYPPTPDILRLRCMGWILDESVPLAQLQAYVQHAWDCMRGLAYQIGTGYPSEQAEAQTREAAVRRLDMIVDWCSEQAGGTPPEYGTERKKVDIGATAMANPTGNAAKAEEPPAGAGGKSGGNSGFTFEPGAFFWKGRRRELARKPLAILRALAEARGSVLTLNAILKTVWEDAVVGEESVRSHIKTARAALRKVIGDNCPADPIPCVERGTGATAWRLDIP